MFQIFNLFILCLLFYIVYHKYNYLSLPLTSTELTETIPITEEFSIQFSHASSPASAPNSKPIMYTLSIPYQNQAQNQLYIASGVKNQAYYTFVDKLSGFFPVKNQISNGSNQNIDLVNDGSIDVAICQEDLAIKKYQETHKNIQFMTGLFDEYFLLLANTQRGINSWKDLKDKKVGFPSKSSGSFFNGVQIANAYGLEAGTDFAYKNVDSTNRLMNLLQDGEFDAVYITSSLKNPFLINVSKNLQIRVIGMNDIDHNIIKTYFPYSHRKHINTNSYQDSLETTKFVNVYTTRAILITNRNSDENVVYSLTKQIYQNVSNLSQLMKNHLHNQQRDNYMRDGFIPSYMFYCYKDFPIHKGAKKYYKEIGFIKEKVLNN